MGVPSASEQVVEMWRSHPDGHLGLLRLVGDLEPERALPLLVEGTKSADARLSEASLFQLQRLDDAGAQALLAMLDDPSTPGARQKHIAQLLLRMGGQAVTARSEALEQLAGPAPPPMDDENAE
jgi:ABC-type transporter Mla MlaB component